MNEKQRQAFRKQMRKGIPEQGEPTAHTTLGLVALTAWAATILYVIGLI